MTETQTLENLTVPEAAHALGLRPSTVRAMIWQRRIAYHKIGSAVRISRAEIDRILRESLVPVKEGR
jgi:excisionase family DNA binding protein